MKRQAEKKKRPLHRSLDEIFFRPGWPRRLTVGFIVLICVCLFWYTMFIKDPRSMQPPFWYSHRY